MKKSVSIFLGALASSAFFLAGCSSGGGALDGEDANDSVSAALTAADDDASAEHSVYFALQKIISKPDTSAACLSAVQAKDVDQVRELLLDHGADADYLDQLTIDLNGADAAPDKAVNTLALGVKYVLSDPKLPPQPAGMVKIGCCWVDWIALLNNQFPWAV